MSQQLPRRVEVAVWALKYLNATNSGTPALQTDGEVEFLGGRELDKEERLMRNGAIRVIRDYIEGRYQEEPEPPCQSRNLLPPQSVDLGNLISEVVQFQRQREGDG